MNQNAVPKAPRFPLSGEKPPLYAICIVPNVRTIVPGNKGKGKYEQFAPKISKLKLVLCNIDSLQYW